MANDKSARAGDKPATGLSGASSPKKAQRPPATDLGEVPGAPTNGPKADCLSLSVLQTFSSLAS